MLASYDAASPLLAGWQYHHLDELQTTFIIPLAPSQSETMAPSPLPGMSLAKPDQGASSETGEPHSDVPATPPAPSPAQMPGQEIVEPTIAPIPAPSASTSPEDSAPGAGSSDAVATPEGKRRRAPGRTQESATMRHLQSAHRDIMAGEVTRAREEMEVAEAGLASRSAAAHGRMASEVGQSLISLTYGDQVSALRHLNNAIAAAP